MKNAEEKFTIEIIRSGLRITRKAGREGAEMTFSPVEALMLLDILKQEEAGLRRMADEASPLSVDVVPV